MHAEHFTTHPSAKTGKRMTWSALIRKTHRWLAITFSVIVALIFMSLAFGGPPIWFYYAPLPFLFVLMFSGLYMFFQPYFSGRRRGSA